MVFCEGDMPTDFELMPEYLPPSVAEKPCPGFDVLIPIFAGKGYYMCGCLLVGG